MSGVAVVDPLAELMSRAGASDADRELWLAERALGVTATEVKQLYMGGASARRELIEKKLHGDSFTGNQYTEWGKLREPVLAEAARLRYAIEPESRVFHAADEPRFLASPDGLGVDFMGDLVAGEYKTSGKHIEPGTDAFDRTGYLLQMVWVMRVTGARRCMYVWEERIQGPEEFEPGRQFFHWIDYDETLAAELEAIADTFLDELDEARRALEAGEEPVYDEAVDTLAVNYLRFLEEEKAAGVAKTEAYRRLKDMVRPRGSWSQKTPLAQVTFSPASVGSKSVLDADAAIAADPGLYERVQALTEEWTAHCAKFTKDVVTEVAERLTVTQGKATRKGKGE